MLKRLYLRLTPETFKNRILFAFLLFLLLPIALLVVYNFKGTEAVLQDNAAKKNAEQLEGFKSGFVDLMSLVMKTGLLLEQDATLRGAMEDPDQYDAIARKRLVENKFAGIENTFFMTGATVYYTLIDLHGHAYTSFMPKSALNYNELSGEAWVKQLKQKGGDRYVWNPRDENVVIRESTASTRMLSLYELLRDDALKPFAYGRLSIDYEEWFYRTAKEGGQEGAYFLVNDSGDALLASDERERVSGTVAEAIERASSLGGDESAPATSIVDEKEQALYTYSRIQELNGYFVKKVPLSLLFKEIDKQKQRFFVGFAGILLLFVLLTYFLSSTITGPLKLFQKKMDTSVKANLKVKLPEHGRGEILALTRSFNAMIDDINGLLVRLKLEEQQKQYVRFQVLLSQMNPHFLLNTLNTIKSIALDKDEDDIYDICVALGTILETTLNTEVDLIRLKDELVLIDAYMDIQRRRFGHGIGMRYDVAGELGYALIPKFCLQPLVENALLHGFGQSVKEGRIVIKAAARGPHLYLEVVDDGMGLERAAERKTARKRKSIGLQNIRESLELLFKYQSTGLTIDSTDAGTRVVMHMPLLLSTPYAKEEDR
ncbi:histidine kinase [Paenibacillus sp. MWE-103]|uniref:Histidine kinase n=1 Tax=Paenibacillus artemisiicola TaxID=1172618 RepID=A0ABS3WDB4_9BACL|nr:histidine kinase [Paenibacillus artemisiicola]MBO7746310.1 histidine kinase [Paenibacillus artemisiicola]